MGKVQFTVHGLNTNAKYKSSQSGAQCVVSSLRLQRVEKVQIQMFNKYKYLYVGGDLKFENTDTNEITKNMQNTKIPELVCSSMSGGRITRVDR